MGWDTTKMIGAMALTLHDIGIDDEDADFVILNTVRAHKRYTDDQIEQAGISWIARILPDYIFTGRSDDD